jgi:hypothetical protein
VQVRMSHCASCVSLDSLPSSFSNKDSHLIEFHKQWPADILLQAAHFYAGETQLSLACRQGLQREDA